MLTTWKLHAYFAGIGPKGNFGLKYRPYRLVFREFPISSDDGNW